MVSMTYHVRCLDVVTLRKERLMMMAFRRWGHFYLALSNEALRKRTKEQNQARSQVRVEQGACCSTAVMKHVVGLRTVAHVVPGELMEQTTNVQPRVSMQHVDLWGISTLLRLLLYSDECFMIHEYGWQRDTPEKVSLSIMERPRNNDRGRSRRSSSSGRHSGGRGRVQMSSSEVQGMVEQEAESVARELAGEPSLSLLALADARKEMDDIAMKAQVRKRP